MIFISIERLVLEISHGKESMLRNMKDLEDYSIGATDGVIGRVNKKIAASRKQGCTSIMAVRPTRRVRRGA